MSAQENKPKVKNDKLLMERAKTLADMVKKIRSTLTVNRGTAIALESMLPGILPATMPPVSFTEDDSPTNVNPLLKLLNEQFDDVIFEAFHVASSRGKDVSTWVSKVEADMEGLHQAEQTIDLLVNTHKPASLRAVELMKKAREENQDLFLRAITDSNLFQIAEDADKAITKVMRGGVVASMIDMRGPSRSTIYEMDRIFRGVNVLPNDISDAIKCAEAILFDNADEADFDVKCPSIDAYREQLGFPLGTPKSELAKAFLFMVERMQEQEAEVAYSYEEHMNEEAFNLKPLIDRSGYSSAYTNAANELERLFTRIQKELKPDIENPGKALSIATRLADVWLMVETMFRAQARLYTEFSRAVGEIQSLVYPVVEAVDRCVRILAAGGVEGTEEVLTDCQIFFKSIARETVSDLY